MNETWAGAYLHRLQYQKNVGDVVLILIKATNAFVHGKRDAASMRWAYLHVLQHQKDVAVLLKRAMKLDNILVKWQRCQHPELLHANQPVLHHVSYGHASILHFMRVLTVLAILWVTM